MVFKSITTEKNKQLYTISIIVVTLLIGFLFYLLNYYTPFYADDYWYTFSFSTGERIESVNQIFDSQVAHYYNTNGRIVTHTFAQLFLLFGDEIFNFINVFFFLILLYLIYFHACGTFKNFSLAKFSMISMLLFLCTPAFGQSFLWLTGAANYLYGILIILCFLIPYRLQLNSDKCKYSLFLEIIASIFYLIFGVIAGWTNENTSVAMIAMIIGYIIFYRLKSVKIHAWNITGCIGGIVGCILVISSPGTANRLEESGGSGGLFIWLKRIFFYTFNTILYLQLILLIFCVLLVVYLYQRRHQLKKQFFSEFFNLFKESGIVLIYLLGFLASIYSMIVSPRFPERVWSGPVILLIISVIGLSSLVDMSNIKFVIGKTVTIGFLLLLSVTTYITAYFDVKNVDSFYDQRVAIIESAISAGEKSVEIPNIKGDTKYTCFIYAGDLKLDVTGEFPNKEMAKYYGIDEIICSD